MSTEQEISALTAATTALLTEIAGQKTQLDQKVRDATAQVPLAAAQAGASAASATAADTRASAAAGSAASALAVYGTAAAMQSALDTARNQANLASGYAAAAGSAQQQDLSGVTAAALHRSPNAITATCVWDLSRDSDGGAWIDRTQHTSWYGEALAGKWLGLQASEASARAVSGATTGDYFLLTTDGKGYRLNASAGTTEVTRGNTPKPGRLVGLAAEAGALLLYALNEPGRPLWMRFPTTGVLAVGNITSVAAGNGQIYVAGSLGLATISLAGDFIRLRTSAGVTRQEGIATRGTNALCPEAGQAGTLVNSQCYAVAMTVLEGAPIDPATGLAVPTIAVGTASGVCVIKQDGTVVNWLPSAGSIATVSLDKNGALLTSGGGGVAWSNYYKNALPTTSPNSTFDATFNETSFPRRLGTDGNTGNIQLSRQAGKVSVFAHSHGAYPLVALVLGNPSSAARRAGAYLSLTYNTGWMVGDIRRVYLCDSAAGSTGATESDRSYKAKAATVYGALVKTPVALGAQLVAFSNWSAVNYIQESFSADLDFGVGSWNASAWVNVPTTGFGPHNLVGGSSFANGLADVPVRLNNTDVTAATGLAAPFPHGTGIHINGGVGAYAYSGATNCASLSLSTAYTVSAYVQMDDGTAPTAAEVRFALVNAASGMQAITLVGGTVYLVSATIGGSNVVANTGLVAAGPAGKGFTYTGLQVKRVNAPLLPYCQTPTAAAYNGIAPIMERAAATGPRITMGLDGAGSLAAEVFDGTTTRRVTSPAAYNNAAGTKVRAEYDPSGALTLKVNGAPVAQTAGAPLLTLNNANAVLTIGNSRTLDAPFPGQIALAKVSGTNPTAEQSTWIYEQEKQLFRAGAQCCLPDSGNVLDLAYDEAQDKWVAVSGANESSWTGLVRTSTAPVAAGAHLKVAAGAGAKLIARSGAGAGVDVTLPAQNLKEELLRRAEAAAQASKSPPPPCEFDALAGQTDFVLPAGYTAVEVISAGASQREGATKAWVRTFDGFRETVKFAVAPGAGTWVLIIVKKA